MPSIHNSLKQYRMLLFTIIVNKCTWIDTVMNQDDVVKYPIEFLNSFDLPVMPPQR